MKICKPSARSYFFLSAAAMRSALRRPPPPMAPDPVHNENSDEKCRVNKQHRYNHRLTATTDIERGE